MSHSTGEFGFSSVTGVLQCDRSFVYSHLWAKVSAGLTNLSGLAVAAFNLFRSNESFTITE